MKQTTYRTGINTSDGSNYRSNKDTPLYINSGNIMPGTTLNSSGTWNQPLTYRTTTSNGSTSVIRRERTGDGTVFRTIFGSDLMNLIPDNITLPSIT